MEPKQKRHQIRAIMRTTASLRRKMTSLAKKSHLKRKRCSLSCSNVGAKVTLGRELPYVSLLSPRRLLVLWDVARLPLLRQELRQKVRPLRLVVVFSLGEAEAAPESSKIVR